MGVLTGGLCFCNAFRLDAVLGGAVVLFRALFDACFCCEAAELFTAVCFFGALFFTAGFFLACGFFAAVFREVFFEVLFFLRGVFEADVLRELDFAADRVPVFVGLFFVFVVDMAVPLTEY